MRIIGESESLQSLVLPTILGMLVPALFLAVLRVEILDLRLQLADNLQREQKLLESRDRLTVQFEELRGLRKLNDLARERGFRRPEQVIDLRAAATRGESVR